MAGKSKSVVLTTRSQIGNNGGWIFKSLHAEYLCTSLVYTIRGMSCVILSLYVGILVPTFSDWISDEDLCYLDSAVCNHSLRQSFIQLLGKVTISISNHDRTSFIKKGCYWWMLLRRLRLKVVHVMNSDSLFKIVKKNKNTHFDVRDSKMLTRVLELGLKVESLVLRRIGQGDIVRTVELNGDFLLSLDIRHCVIDTTVVSHIALFCRNLKTFYSPDHLIVLPAFKSTNIEVLGLDVLNEFGHGAGGKSLVYCHLERSDKPDGTISRDNNKFKMTSLEVKSELPPQSLSFLLDHCCSLTSLRMTRSKANQFVDIANKCGPNLTHLRIDRCNFDQDSICKALKVCNKLKILNFEDQDVNESTVRSIVKYCPLLEVLPAAFSELQKLPSMTTMVLKWLRRLSFVLVKTTLNEELISVLAGQIGQLEVRSNQDSTMELDRSAHYTRLSICNSTNIPNELFTKIFVQNRQLVKVVLEGQSLSDNLIISMVDYCSGLSSIAILNCTRLTSKIVVKIAECKNLTQLSISGMKQIRDAMIYTLLCDKPSFVKLSLSECTGFTGQVLSMVAKYCPIIRHLNFSSCDFFSDRDVLELLQSCPKLKHLDLTDCANLTSDIVPTLKARHIQHVNVRGTAIPEVTGKSMNAWWD